MESGSRSPGTSIGRTASAGAFPRCYPNRIQTFRYGTSRVGVFRTERFPTIQSDRIHGGETETSICTGAMPHGAGTGGAGHELTERTVNPRRSETSTAIIPYLATNEGRSASEEH